MQAETVTILPSDFDNLTTKGGIRVPYPDVIRSPVGTVPPDPDNMNDLRAQWADDALVSFERDRGDQEKFVQNLANLLCYIGHWCDRNGLQLAKVWKMAAKRYSDETEGQGRQFSA